MTRWSHLNCGLTDGLWTFEETSPGRTTKSRICCRRKCRRIYNTCTSLTAWRNRERSIFDKSGRHTFAWTSLRLLILDSLLLNLFPSRALVLVLLFLFLLLFLPLPLFSSELSNFCFDNKSIRPNASEKQPWTQTVGNIFLQIGSRECSLLLPPLEATRETKLPCNTAEISASHRSILHTMLRNKNANRRIYNYRSSKQKPRTFLDSPAPCNAPT